MGECRKCTMSLFMLLSLSVMFTGCSSQLYTSLVSSDEDLSRKLANLVASPSSRDGRALQSSQSKTDDALEAGVLDQGAVLDNPVGFPPSPRLDNFNSQSGLARAGQMPGNQQGSHQIADEGMSNDSLIEREMDIAAIDGPMSPSNEPFFNEGDKGISTHHQSVISKPHDDTSDSFSTSSAGTSSEDILPLDAQDLLTGMAAASGTNDAAGHGFDSFSSRKKGARMSALGDELLGEGSIGDVFFDFDAATIRSDAESTLQVNAQILKASFENREIVIEGHCDERGTAEYNLVLGERRAQSTKQYLVDLGVSSSTIQTISYGKEKPFCQASQPDCWKQNRRGHFVFE